MAARGSPAMTWNIGQGVGGGLACLAAQRHAHRHHDHWAQHQHGLPGSGAGAERRIAERLVTAGQRPHECHRERLACTVWAHGGAADAGRRGGPSDIASPGRACGPRLQGVASMAVGAERRRGADYSIVGAPRSWVGRCRPGPAAMWMRSACPGPRLLTEPGLLMGSAFDLSGDTVDWRDRRRLGPRRLFPV